MAEWKFEVTEDGRWVAGGSAPSEQDTLNEARHYVMMYGQDGGDVKALVWTGRKPKLKAAETFVCQWCGAKEKTLNGLCPKCHRFGNTNKS